MTEKHHTQQSLLKKVWCRIKGIVAEEAFREVIKWIPGAVMVYILASINYCIEKLHYLFSSFPRSVTALVFAGVASFILFPVLIWRYLGLKNNNMQLKNSLQVLRKEYDELLLKYNILINNSNMQIGLLHYSYNINQRNICTITRKYKDVRIIRGPLHIKLPFSVNCDSVYGSEIQSIEPIPPARLENNWILGSNKKTWTTNITMPYGIRGPTDCEVIYRVANMFALNQANLTTSGKGDYVQWSFATPCDKFEADFFWPSGKKFVAPILRLHVNSNFNEPGVQIFNAQENGDLNAIACLYIEDNIHWKVRVNELVVPLVVRLEWEL